MKKILLITFIILSLSACENEEKAQAEKLAQSNLIQLGAENWTDKQKEYFLTKYRIETPIEEWTARDWSIYRSHGGGLKKYKLTEEQQEFADTLGF